MSSQTDGWFLDADGQADWPDGDVSMRTAIDSLSDAFYVVDRRGRFVDWNDAFRAATGYTDAEIAALHQFDVIPDGREARARELLSAVADGETVTFDAPLLAADGTETLHEFTASPLTDDDGEVRGMAGTARDVSTRENREELLREVHAASRRLMRAETKMEVADAAADLVRERFEYATVGVRLLDDDTLVLASLATDGDAPDATVPTYEVGEGFVGEVYERGEAVVRDDLRDADLPIDYDPVRSALLLPMPGQGMLNVGATEPDAFDEADVELGRLFAADVRLALQRADREERLRDRKHELARLNRINELIRETIHALTSTATRDEIEATVCERLAESEFYRLVWIGEPMSTDGPFSHRAWAGEGEEYLTTVDRRLAAEDVDEGPGERAVRTGSVYASQDVATDPDVEQWRDFALDYGFRSLVVVPLTNGETVHGALSIYAGHTGAFGQRERRAFEVLGETVGFAISATQNRRLIEDDGALEIELRLSEAGTVAADLTERLGCRYRLLGLTSTADPGLVHYVAAEGATPDEIHEIASNGPASDRIADYRVVQAEGDSCLLEVRIVDGFAEIMRESGVRTVDATAEDGRIDVVGRGPRDLDIRTLLDALESTHGDADLVAKRDVAADRRIGETFEEAITDRLTDRQEAALNAAYFGGYFDWPRDSTAEEVAEALGITSATLHQHLRHAQRKLLESCFVDASRDDLDT